MPSHIDTLVDELVKHRLESRKFYLKSKIIKQMTGFPIRVTNANGTDGDVV